MGYEPENGWMGDLPPSSDGKDWGRINRLSKVYSGDTAPGFLKYPDDGFVKENYSQLHPEYESVFLLFGGIGRLVLSDEAKQERGETTDVKPDMAQFFLGAKGDSKVEEVVEELEPGVPVMSAVDEVYSRVRDGKAGNRLKYFTEGKSLDDSVEERYLPGLKQMAEDGVLSMSVSDIKNSLDGLSI